MNKKDLTLFFVWCWFELLKKRQAHAEYVRGYRKSNPDKVREAKRRFRAKHADRVRDSIKEWKKNNPDKVRAASRRYYVKHSEDIRNRVDSWVEKNRPKLRATQRAWKAKRYEADVGWRLKNSLSARVRSALLGKIAKQHKTAELIGCSIPELRTHLERKFLPGMHWGNYGEWHIDHIRPCSSFDLTIPDQQKECFSFRNLQPLWAIDNIKKGDRYTPITVN